jgi:hypothetical protein
MVAKFVRGFTQVRNTFEYFTPRDDSPFSVLDDDKPTFPVGVTVPMFAGTGDGEATPHTYVWDRGTVRDVMLPQPDPIPRRQPQRLLHPGGTQ